MYCLANMTYSSTGCGSENCNTSEIYESEWPHFLEAITDRNEDKRLFLPEGMIIEIQAMLSE